MVPSSLGDTLIDIVQLSPLLSVVGQSLVCSKGVDTEILLIVMGAFPEFDTGIEMASLSALTATVPKSTSDVTVNSPTRPTPESAMGKLKGFLACGTVGVVGTVVGSVEESSPDMFTAPVSEPDV
jgi:hypothetical protein